MNLVYRWPHKIKGVEIGEIKRFLVEENGKSRKVDIPYYTPSPDGWLKGIPESLRPWPLLGLDTVTNVQRTVVICEGQKKQHAWRGLGFQAVATLCGSGAAEQTDWSPLKGCRKFWISPDNDQAGEHYAETVWNILRKFEPEMLNVVRLPNVPRKGDVCDWLKLQPELSDWNEYDPLDDHPNNKELRERLATVCMNVQREPSWVPQGEWQEPINLETGLARVHPMPPDLVPPVLRPWILDAAERMGAPLEYLAIGSIICLGAAIGASVSIRPKRFDVWSVVPNLWGCIVGPVSSMKSPSLREVKGPLEHLDTRNWADYEAAKAEYDKAKFAYDAKLSAAKSRANQAAGGKPSKYVGGEVETAEDIASELPPPPEPPACKRFICKDATQEALCQILAANPRGVLLYQDELYGLISGWDKEGRQTDRPFMLTGWNGNEPHTVDRATKPNLRIPNLCISILGGMQPDTLQRYLVEAGDNLNDGLMQRFQLMILMDESERDGVDKQADTEARERARGLFMRIAEMNWVDYGASTTPYETIPYFNFSNEAQELFFEWEKLLRQKCRARDTEPVLKQHLDKYRSLMPSLALIFHLLDVADRNIQGPVTLESAQLAADWCAFLEEHARRVYAMAKPRALGAVHQLANKILAGSFGNRFAWYQVQQKHWRGLRQKTEILEACRQLQEFNWLRQVENREHRSGPPKLEFRVNPKVNIRVS